MLNQQINFFQPIFRKERKFLSFRVLLQGTGAVMMLLVLMFGWSWRQTTQIESDFQRIQGQLNDRNLKLAVLGEKLARMNNDTGAQESLLTLERELVARQKVVNELIMVRDTYTRGVSTYLESFSRQAPKGVWLTSFAVKAGGAGLVLRGRSLEASLVPTFLQQLAAEPAMSGTHFSTLQIQREQPETRYVDFSVHTENEQAWADKP